MRTARWIALLLLVGAALTAVEGGVRAITRLSGRCHPACLIRHDDLLGWSFSPGAVGRHRVAALGFDVTYHLNRAGYRSPDYPTVAAAGVRRLVVVGDSNGFGWGVADDRHFSALLAAADPHVEVVNLSVSGYGTDQEFLRLRRDGLTHSPDVVLLQVTPNDLADIRRRRIGGRTKPRFSLSSTGALRLHTRPTRPSVEELLLASCYACAWLHGRLQPDAAAGTAEMHDSGDGDNVTGLFRELVRAAGRLAAEAGATLLVVHAVPELDAALGNLAEVSALNVTPHFTRARAAGEEPLFADGLHWNARGHRAVADAVGEHITSLWPDRSLRRGLVRP